MNKFTDYFKINKVQRDVDFVKLDAEGDTRLFINPTLLRFSTDETLSSIGTEKVESFFLEIFNLYSTGRRAEALNLFTSSGETNANHLGYSRGQSRGNGASKRALAKLFDTILKSGALAEDIMTKPMSLLIFAHDFGEDRMSDLVTSILKKELVDYTLKIANLYDIKVEENEISYGKCWNQEKGNWISFKEKWIKGADGKPVMFTPKQIVSEQYGFSVRQYVNQIVFTWRKDFHVTNRTSLAQPKYNKAGELTYKAPANWLLKEKEIDAEYKNVEGKWKLYAIDMTIENPSLYNQYFERFTAGGLSGKNQILTDEQLTQIVDNN
jgi:hypothetical protein